MWSDCSYLVKTLSGCGDRRLMPYPAGGPNAETARARRTFPTFVINRIRGSYRMAANIYVILAERIYPVLSGRTVARR